MLLRSGFSYFLKPKRYKLRRVSWRGVTVGTFRRTQKFLRGLTKPRLDCAMVVKNTIKDQSKRSGSWAHKTRQWAKESLARRFSKGSQPLVPPHTIPGCSSQVPPPIVQFTTVREEYQWKDPMAYLQLANPIGRWLGRKIGLDVTVVGDWELVNIFPYYSNLGQHSSWQHEFKPKCFCWSCKPAWTLLCPKCHDLYVLRKLEIHHLQHDQEWRVPFGHERHLQCCNAISKFRKFVEFGYTDGMVNRQW